MSGTVAPTRRRTAGILLHVTSLPGPFGVGDLGPAARTWVDLLAGAGQTWWQFLPLNPTGPGGSPYSPGSAFAGNTLLVSPDDLAAEGLLRADELSAAHVPTARVDYPRATAAKNALLDRAWSRFRAGAAPQLHSAFETFCDATEWLADYALYAALRDVMPNREWTDWPAELTTRVPAALAQATRELAEPIDRHRFAQFVFARQVAALRRHAAARGVKLLGDAPMFMAADAADVWTHPHLFALDARRRPRVVSGAPPDPFSATGQRWGHPVYDWAAMERDGFRWWVARVRAVLAHADAVRLDHFRGFQAYWALPANEAAAGGCWVMGPGHALFDALRGALRGTLPFVAEDLGVITPEVDALRKQIGVPGMRVLPFGFGTAEEDRFRPHGYERDLVACTGTHDTDTLRGWYGGLAPAAVAALHRYAPEAAHDPVRALTRLTWASVADTAVVPFQDVFGLGSEARMNVPGPSAGNWSWRATSDQFENHHFGELRELTATYGRSPDQLNI